MKLRELAEIKKGISLDTQKLKKEKRSDGIYFQYIQATDFSTRQSNFVLQKELRKTINYSPKSFLFYGDYVLYKLGSSYKMFRYEDNSAQTIAGNGLIVITSDLSILKDFFSTEKNRRYFCNELEQLSSESTSDDFFYLIGDIEIPTDDILELETANVAEQIGIRNPIDFADVPFNIYQKPLPIDKLLKRIKEKELLLDTEFQRRPGLWDIPTKSRLIESMIIRLPIPAFYFDGSDDGKWLVIDGLQRLSAVNDFVNNNFVLAGLDYLPELESKSFNELDRIHQRNIEEFEVFAYIIQKGTPKAVIYKIFKNINTSALKLEPQEIRHALNPGVPASLLKRIAEQEWFKTALKLTDRQRDRMEDRETALRFLAFQITRFNEYSPPMVDFLDLSMSKLYDIFTTRQVALENELQNILETLYEFFGDNAFSRNLFDDSRTYGHNNIMFELLTYGFSLLSSAQRKELMISRPDIVSKSIVAFFANKNESFWDYDSAYSQEGVRTRFSEIEILFKSLKNDQKN